LEKSEQKGIVLKRKHIVILVIVIVALVVGGIFLGLYLSRPPASPDSGFAIDPGAGSPQAPAPSGGSAETIKIPGYPQIPLAAGQKDISIELLNPEGNPCYFKFELVLTDTDEVLYTSDWVPPGQAVTKQTLSRGLDAGNYAAEIRITTASLDDSHSPMNGSNVKTTLIVK